MFWDKVSKIYDSIIRRDLSIRRITIVFNDVIDSLKAINKINVKQLDLFSNNNELEEYDKKLETELALEKNIQKAIIKIQNKLNSFF